MLRIQFLKTLLVLLALGICAGNVQASALVATSNPTNNTITCDAIQGSSTLSIALTLPSAGTAATSVAAGAVAGLTITPPGGTGVNSTSGTAFTWTITESGACKTPGTTANIVFTPTGGNTSAVTVAVTFAAPNNFLALSAGASSANPLLVYCNAATGVTTGTVNVSAAAGAGALSSSRQLTLALAPTMSVTADSTTTPVLASSPITITTSSALTFSSGSVSYTVGVRSSTCLNLSQNSPNTTATIMFTSMVGASSSSNVPMNDSALLYVKVIQQAPVTVSGPITLQCTANGTTASPIAPPANNVTVSTASSSSISVNVNPPAWVTLNGGGAGTALTSQATVHGTALSVSAAPAGTCNGFVKPGLSATANITVTPASNQPWANVTIPVTLQTVSASPLTATPTTLSLTYRKGGPAATGTIALSSSSAAGSYFTVAGQQLGSYIVSDTASGTAPKTGTRVVTFSTTGLNDTLAPGTNTYTVYFHVSGCADLPVTIKVTVNNATPVLTVSEGTTRSIMWDPSTAVPTPTMTLVSSDTPIAYTISGLSGIVTGPTTGGLAFNYGTPVTVTFDGNQFQSAAPGQTLTGKLTVTGGNTTLVITFNVLVTASSTTASLGALVPSNLPTGVAGQVFTLNLYGSGFVSSTTPNYSTIVGLATNTSAANFYTSEAAISYKVVNSSNIVVTITVPSTGKDAHLDFTQSGNVFIGACNPNGGTCTPSAALQLSIGSGPYISSVTSAASFVQFSSAANGTPAVAPYDLISIFGANFCNANGTGCGTGVILGKPDVNNVFGPTLSPDGNRNITVNFYRHPAPSNLGTATPLMQAPLLFATDKQINAIVPGDNANMATVAGDGYVDIAVGFGASGSVSFSNVVTVAVGTVDPGILTIGSDGAGNAAALATGTYALINNVNPAVIRPGTSDTVQIYMSGLGAPDTTNPACITVSAYDTAASLPNGLDGAVILPSYTGILNAPCFTTPTTSALVSFGTVASATENFAGWVSSSIAGLYQVNAVLPPNTGGAITDAAGASSPFTAPTQLPVKVTSGLVSSLTNQPSVTMWVAPQLDMAAFTDANCVGNVSWGTYSCGIPAVTGGSGYTYTYSALPTNVTFSTPNFVATTAATPVGSYLVSVTAKDGTTPETLSVTGSFNIYSPGANQTIRLTGTTPTPSLYGVPNNFVSTVTAVGVSTYTYSVTTGSAFAAVDSNGVVSITGSAPIGANQIVVKAIDNADSTKLGTLTLYAPVNLNVSSSNGASLNVNASSAGAVLTNLSSAGAAGVVTYTLVAGSPVVAVSSAGVVTLGTASQNKTYSATVKASDGSNVGYINLSIHTN